MRRENRVFEFWLRHGRGGGAAWLFASDVSEPYEEILGGETLLRAAPGARHETICARLHGLVGGAMVNNKVSRLLGSRDAVQLGRGTMVRPDLAVVASATGKLWLAVEVVSSEDHRPDTVVKKALYEEHKAPRLWMVDPRYDNAEVYHATPYGLALKGILSNKEILREPLLSEFACPVAALFGL